MTFLLVFVYPISPNILNNKKMNVKLKNKTSEKVTFFHPWAHCAGCSLTQFLTKILCQYGANFANKRPSWVKNLIILSYKWGQGAALLSF